MISFVGFFQTSGLPSVGRYRGNRSGRSMGRDLPDKDRSDEATSPQNTEDHPPTRLVPEGQPVERGTDDDPRQDVAPVRNMACPRSSAVRSDSCSGAHCW
jgi:hypothetical protein